ncbi:hypothetical protein CFP71_10055 [Amycolatopsis thailandensis]|uniref:Uncharacterized protein n=1 Tax=Amycolatopsis thailandensis TaxID=589330 RepID=A0A229SEB3_9PSEU|nr:hypothetical protein [Amycolatopsis thailandensis]OXM57069.1 hypothetical protein CFP71_10055 [Amycolatopsis thailandensis]
MTLFDDEATAASHRTISDGIAARAEQIATELRLVVHPQATTFLDNPDITTPARPEPVLNGQNRAKSTADDDEPDHDNGFVLICLYADDRDEVFPAWVSPRRWNGWAVPQFSREAAERVVDWINRLHAEAPDGIAAAVWHGGSILLFDTEWEEYGLQRITPTQHGRYVIGDSWIWEVEKCRVCRATSYPGEDEGSRVLLHEPHCPSGSP